MRDEAACWLPEAPGCAARAAGTASSRARMVTRNAVRLCSIGLA